MTDTAQLLSAAAALIEAFDIPSDDQQLNMPFLKAPKEAMRQHLLDGDARAWDRVLKKLGVPLEADVEYLGGGNHGAAFQIGDRVLKLTDDPIEANAAMQLKLKPMKEAYTVYEVYKLKDHDRVYVLWLEVLEPADAPYLRLATAWRQYGLSGDAELTPRHVKVFTDLYADYMAPEVAAWLKAAAKNLTDRGIVHRDLHAGNLMKRPNGEHVVIDIGHRSSAPRKAITKASKPG